MEELKVVSLESLETKTQFYRHHTAYDLTYEFPPATFKNKKFDHVLNISTSLPGLLVYS